MTIEEAQSDMRRAYLGGAPGILVSGLVWIIAGMTALLSTKQMSILVFFLAGMFIHPLGIFLSKMLKCSGKHEKDNPLGQLAMETTFLLFAGLLIAYLVFQVQANWFYPIMLLIIGARYLMFASIYGMRIYWLLGLVLAISGMATVYFMDTFYLGAFLGGIMEVVFAAMIFRLEKSIS